MTNPKLLQTQPTLYEGLIGMNRAAERAIADAGLGILLQELVKIRVSQLNNCAFCLRMHTADALKAGETPDRLAVLGAWWETEYFSPAERSALALAEQVTELPVPERTDWDDGVLTDEQAGAVAWLAIVMNSWNRVSITSHHRVAPGAGRSDG